MKFIGINLLSVLGNSVALPYRTTARQAIVGLILVSLAVVICASISTSVAAERLPEQVRFNDHIRPIFTKHCIECHGGVKKAAELSFVHAVGVLPPDGWVIERGDPDESILIQRVSSDDPDYRMPPVEHGKALSEREIALLRRWVEQGAAWEHHWAFVCPRPQTVPEVTDPSWCRTPIDRFILARLEQEGISPSSSAIPERWFRRVHLDLIGLPPSLEGVTEFLEDVSSRGEAAYESAVDRLLASPQFGERWASVWLDQIRYADSRGLGIDGRRNVWKYRDWVIDAINRDVPFDRFTIQQIAGDLLPDTRMEDLVATACHRLTQTNTEGGTDDEEFRVEAVLDRVNTTWQAWQGVTFGCVRCHDHPYDPFRHEEYYRFAAFFNNSQDSDLGEEYPVLQVPIDGAQYATARQLDRESEAIREEIWQSERALVVSDGAWRPITDLQATTNNDTRLVVEPHGDRAEFRTVGTVTKDADFTLDAKLPDGLEELTAIRVTIMPLDSESAVQDSEWGFVLSHVEAELITTDESEPLKLAYVIGDEPAPFLNPQESLNSGSNRGFSAYTRIHYPRTAAFVLTWPRKIAPGAKVRVTLKHRAVVVASFPLISRRGHLAVSDDAAFIELLVDDARAKKLHRIAELKADRDRIESTPLPVMLDRPDHLRRPIHVFARGAYLSKENQVTAGVPESFPPLRKGVRADRLALAKWLVSSENPLTARVAVNRFWARLFETGLVATEEDFGSSGEPPSHPELLDYLALRFENEHAWSVKRLLRELTLSSTYRQSSKRRPELAERDPHNRLLATGPRARLSGEMVRDQALAISGLLVNSQFGPPVHPPIPEGVWRPFSKNDEWITPPVGDPERYRRAIYTYTKRSIPYPLFATFDAPSREVCMPRRLQSNTPLQALTTLNDSSFTEFAHALAKRMIGAGATTRERLRYGFMLATCRQPRKAELDDLQAFYDQLPPSKSESERMELVAGVLLNLDEVLNK